MSHLPQTMQVFLLDSVLIRRLLDDEILKEDNKVFVFQQDYIFNSPSAAAASILGRNKNAFPNSESSQKKSCPKSAFLGLCEAGLVKAVSKGKYTRSIDNKAYAVKAIDILRSNTKINYTPKELWTKVKEELFIEKKAHNSQMDVVLALWNEELILPVKSSLIV